MWLIIRILRIFPPEIAHKISLTLLFFIHRLGLLSIFKNEKQSETIEFLGLRFKNTLGTAAGLDKNGDYIDCLGALGFGFLEVGTITPKAQAGNKKPRVFRLSKDQGVINRLGFNNKGIDHLVTNLKQHKYDGVIGVNIGANKNSQKTAINRKPHTPRLAYISTTRSHKMRRMTTAWNYHLQPQQNANQRTPLPGAAVAEIEEEEPQIITTGTHPSTIGKP